MFNSVAADQPWCYCENKTKGNMMLEETKLACDKFSPIAKFDSEGVGGNVCLYLVYN